MTISYHTHCKRKIDNRKRNQRRKKKQTPADYSRIYLYFIMENGKSDYEESFWGFRKSCFSFFSAEINAIKSTTYVFMCLCLLELCWKLGLTCVSFTLVSISVQWDNTMSTKHLRLYSWNYNIIIDDSSASYMKNVMIVF